MVNCLCILFIMKNLLQEKDISRINKYGNQSWCVAKTQPQLNKYCYCKNQN